MPILIPLAGFDKEEIILQAKKIGTFEVSIEPSEDCCTLVVPENPQTRAHPKMLTNAEKLLDVSKLMEQALEHAEIVTFDGSGTRQRSRS